MVVMTILWAVWVLALCLIMGVRGRRSPSDRVALGALCIMGMMAGLLWGERHIGVWTGFLVALSLATGWKLPGRVRLLLSVFAGLTLGFSFYQGGPSVIGGGLLGLLVSGAAFYGLRPAKNPPLLRVPPYRQHMLVCQGRACRAHGAQLLLGAMGEFSGFRARKGHRITAVRCLGACSRAPVVAIEPEGLVFTSVKLRDLKALSSWGGAHED